MYPNPINPALRPPLEILMNPAHTLPKYCVNREALSKARHRVVQQASAGVGTGVATHARNQVALLKNPRPHPPSPSARQRRRQDSLNTETPCAASHLGECHDWHCKFSSASRLLKETRLLLYGKSENE